MCRPCAWHVAGQQHGWHLGGEERAKKLGLVTVMWLSPRLLGMRREQPEMLRGKPQGAPLFHAHPGACEI